MIKKNQTNYSLFGLPEKVEFCKKCVESNQRFMGSTQLNIKKNDKKLGVSFDSEGVCLSCRYYEKKEKVDWKEREKELEDILSRHRKKDGSYDVSAVWNVIEDIKAEMESIANHPKNFVVGCTTNPGDCDVFQDKLSEVGMDVYYNPEFIAQGSIVCDLRFADMVLVGGNGHHVPLIEEIYKRIQDGFELAESDLNLRGPGDYLGTGTRQSGLPPLKIAKITDHEVVTIARQEAIHLLEIDPNLSDKDKLLLSKKVLRLAEISINQ